MAAVVAGIASCGPTATRQPVAAPPTGTAAPPNSGALVAEAATSPSPETAAAIGARDEPPRLATAKPSAPYRVLMALAFAAESQGNYELCQELFAEASVAGPASSFELHNAAACAARRGSVERAFDYLELSRQYPDAWRVDILLVDPDLEVLRSHSRWPGVVEATRDNRRRLFQGHSQELAETFERELLELEGRGEVTPEQYRQNSRRRKDRVRALMKQPGAVNTARDYAHASYILGLGEATPDDVFAAQIAARSAVRLDPKSKLHRSTLARTTDKAELARGKPQKYGTVTRVRGGRMAMPPVDPSVTDSDRVAAGVAPLAEARRAMNITNAAFFDAPVRQAPVAAVGAAASDPTDERPPQIVPSQVLEQQRTHGAARIPPPMSVRVQMVKRGESDIRTAVKMCVDRRGRVMEVRLIKRTGYDEYDQLLLDMTRLWRYRPLLVGGRPAAVCTTVTFIYRQS